jgi:GcrA cell cycle regulator
VTVNDWSGDVIGDLNHDATRRQGMNSMRADSWSDERIAVLKRLWAEGQSASAIAKALGGISRSAVLGKIFRLRLGAAAEAAPARTVARPSCASPHKSLNDLTNESCRWPHGRPGAANFFFCGASGADLDSGRPYCAHHMRRAYVIPPAVTAAPQRAVSRIA